MGYYYLAEVFYNKRRKLMRDEKSFIIVWRNMMQRCYDKNNISYKNYGSRGIDVCWRWHNFENFYKDMYDDYVSGISLDRVDNNGCYEPTNCKWSTRAEQAMNRRTNRLLSFNGVKMTLGEWANKLNIKRSTLEMRLDAYGWDLKKALTTTVRDRRVVP